MLILRTLQISSLPLTGTAGFYGSISKLKGRYVDIFLALLIIFMITSSVADLKAIPVNLPKAAHAGT